MHNFSFLALLPNVTCWLQHVKWAINMCIIYRNVAIFTPSGPLRSGAGFFSRSKTKVDCYKQFSFPPRDVRDVFGKSIKSVVAYTFLTSTFLFLYSIVWSYHGLGFHVPEILYPQRCSLKRSLTVRGRKNILKFLYQHQYVHLKWCLQ